MYVPGTLDAEATSLQMASAAASPVSAPKVIWPSVTPSFGVTNMRLATTQVAALHMAPGAQSAWVAQVVSQATPSPGQAKGAHAWEVVGSTPSAGQSSDAPSQVSTVSQVSVAARHGVSTSLGAQVPSLPPVAAALQLPQASSQAASQHTSSTQKPLSQSLPPLQASPSSPEVGGGGGGVADPLPPQAVARLSARPRSSEVQAIEVLRFMS